MSDQYREKFMWKTVLFIWLGGAVIYLQTGGYEELQTLLDGNAGATEHAAAGGMERAAVGGIDATEKTGAAPAPAAPAGSPAPTPPPVPTPASAPPSPSVKGVEAPAPPGFDVARAQPTGEILIAGRAEPDWTVRVETGGAAFGEGQADGGGAWVIIPEKALPPGEHTLSLVAVAPDGKRTLNGSKTVRIVVPDLGAARVADAEGSRMAEPKEKASVTAKAEGMTPPARAGSPAAGEADKSAAKSAVKDPADAPPAGGVSERGGPEAGALPPGVPPRRRDAGGETRHERVHERIHDDPPRAAARQARRQRHAPAWVVTVGPGDSLWRLAKRHYGCGCFYTRLYNTNRDRIDNPHQIYPRQRLMLAR